jgi:hypothetical protein
MKCLHYCSDVILSVITAMFALLVTRHTHTFPVHWCLHPTNTLRMLLAVIRNLPQSSHFEVNPILCIPMHWGLRPTTTLRMPLATGHKLPQLPLFGVSPIFA